MLLTRSACAQGADSKEYLLGRDPELGPVTIVCKKANWTAIYIIGSSMVVALVVMLVIIVKLQAEVHRLRQAH